MDSQQISIPWTLSIPAPLKSTVTENQFDSAITVWLRKPHTVNRRLIGAKILHETEVLTLEDCFKVIWNNIVDLRKDQDFDALVTKLDEVLVSSPTEKSVSLCIRDLIPKQLERFHTARELIVKCGESVVFFPLYHTNAAGQYQHPDLTLLYGIRKQHDSLVIDIGPAGPEDPPPCPALGVSEDWLRVSLLPRLVSWCQADSLNLEVSSLKLVPVDEYTAKYQQLKAKHGPRLVESWQENTDPRKFVYEDIAIATYLLLLWEQDRREKSLERKQSFVDLGCGNGLLVHLLALEGHQGLGIDVRRRKIWEQYGEETVLKEMSITPSDQHLFPDYDWLIGNHSDELTPWIPVMAARSSYRCSYFVLPCCQWDFSARFSERKSGSSQYRTYLDYVHDVGRVCGFHVEEDALRIPSTKRVCFIGRNKTYKEEDEAQKDSERTAFIQSRTRQTVKRSHEDTENHGNALSGSTVANTEEEEENGKWAESFQARKAEEATSNNCLNVDKNIKELITMRVFQALLEDDNKKTIVLDDKGEYNMGGALPLGDVIQLFDGDTLKRLKNECGGMQTLLRNNHQLFHVEKGSVRLRDWTDEQQHLLHQHAKKKRKGQKTVTASQRKTRLCFLHQHHPQGCPLTAGQCRFAHGQGELREQAEPGGKGEG